ncbi:hypothetical protein MXB_2782, partial [Myxobolus squamalis]
RERLSILYSNISACHLKLFNNEKVIKYSTFALKFAPRNPKALYRRAMAYEMQKKYQDAFSDIKLLLTLLTCISDENSLNLCIILLSLYINKNYDNTQFVFSKLQIEILEKAVKNKFTLAVADFLASSIENIVTNYSNMHAPPDKSENFIIKRNYKDAFLSFLKNDSCIVSYFTLLLEGIKSTTPNYPPELHGIRSVNRVLKQHEYVSEFSMDYNIVKILISFNIPNDVTIADFCEYLDQEIYLSNLVSTCLETVFSVAKGDEKLINEYFSQIDKILECSLRKLSKNHLIFFVELFPIVHINTEVLNYILLESPQAYGDKILEVVSEISNCSIENEFKNYHDNFLVFLCDLLISCQNCVKYKENAKFRNVSLKIFEFAYKHKTKKLQITGLLALSKFFSTDNASSKCLLEYFEKATIFSNCDVESYEISCVEVLSFLSLNGDIKEAIVNNHILIESLYRLTTKMCDRILLIKNSSSDIDNVRYLPKIFCSLSILANLASISIPDTISNQEEDIKNKKKELKKLAASIGQPLPKKHPKNKKVFVKERIKRLSTPKYFTLLASIVSCLKCSDDHPYLTKGMLSKHSPYYVSSLYYVSLQQHEARGMAAQAGAVKALLSLCSSLKIGVRKPSIGPGYLDAPYIAAHALSLIAIALNPAICFNDQSIMDSIEPLLCICDFEHANLRRFEALLALTNIVSANSDVRNYFAIIESGFNIIETAIFDSNPLIKKAAVELTTNMLVNKKFIDKYFCPDQFSSQKLIEVENRDRKAERIRIFQEKLMILISVGNDNLIIPSAATGGLAIMSHQEILCQYMMDVNPFFEIINQLLLSGKPNIVYRALYTLNNIINHDDKQYRETVKSNCFGAISELQNQINDDKFFEKANQYLQEILKSFED